MLCPNHVLHSNENYYISSPKVRMKQKLQNKNSMKTKILPFIAAFSFSTNSPACAEYIGAFFGEGIVLSELSTI